MKIPAIRLQNVLIYIQQHTAKMIVLSMLFSVLTFASIAIPYVNILLSPKIILTLLLVSWYILFRPSVTLLLNLSILIVFGSLGIVLLRFREIAEWFGEFLYLLLICILIRFLYETIIQNKQQRGR